MSALPKIGFDTEAFLRNSRGEMIPMGGLIPGSKATPHKIHHAQDFFIQEDGVTVETNTPVSSTPAEAHRLLNETWQLAEQWLRKFLPTKIAQEMRTAVGRKIFDPSNVALEYYTDYEFDNEKLQLAGPQAFVFGCDPDFNAYEYDHTAADPKKRDVQNQPIDITTIGGLRFAGGHVHFGYDTSVAPPHVVVQMLDLIQVALGTLDRRSARSKYYGKPGCYRIKPYGVEYRTTTTGQLLSQNGLAFLTHAHTMLRLPKKSMLFLYRKWYSEILRTPNGDNDVKAAKEFIKDLSGLAL